jgi:hypothetical protein
MQLNLFPCPVIDPEPVDSSGKRLCKEQITHADRRFEGRDFTSDRAQRHGKNAVSGPDIENLPPRFHVRRQYIDYFVVIMIMLHPELIPPRVTIPESDRCSPVTNCLFHAPLAGYASADSASRSTDPDKNETDGKNVLVLRILQSCDMVLLFLFL